METERSKKLGRRPSIEDYVKTLAARVGLPAPIVKAAVELLKKKRLLVGKTRGCGPPPPCGWRRVGSPAS